MRTFERAVFPKAPSTHWIMRCSDLSKQRVANFSGMLQGYRQSERGDSCLLRRQIRAAPKIRWAKHQVVFWLLAEGKSLLAHCRRPFVGAEQRANDAHVRIYISQRCHFPDASPPHCISSRNKKSCWHVVRPRGVIHHCGRKEAQDYSRGLVRLCSLLRRLVFFLALRHQTVPQTGSYTSRWAEEQKNLLRGKKERRAHHRGLVFNCQEELKVLAGERQKRSSRQMWL